MILIIRNGTAKLQIMKSFKFPIQPAWRTNHDIWFALVTRSEALFKVEKHVRAFASGVTICLIHSAE